MTLTISTNNAHFVQGLQPYQDFVLSNVQNPIVVGGSNNVVVDKDISFNQVIGAGIVPRFTVGCSMPAVFSSLNTSVATVDSSGNCTYVANGQAQIEVAVAGVGSRVYSQTLDNTVSTAYTSISSYASGSLIKYWNDQMTALCSYLTASAGGSTQANQQYLNFTTPSSTLLTGLTGVSGWTPFDVSQVANNNVSEGAMCWISPHHWISGIGAAHGANPVEGSTCFVGQDIVIGYSSTPWAGPIVKFLPVGWQSYLPLHSETFPMSGVPVWVRFTNIYNGSNYWVEPVVCDRDAGYAHILPPLNASLAPYCHANGSGYIATGGDSGSPVFAGINGTPVLLGRVYGFSGWIDWYGNVLTSASATDPTTSNTNWPPNSWATDITSAMNLLASLNSDMTVYSLSYVSLAGFTTF